VPVVPAVAGAAVAKYVVLVGAMPLQTSPATVRIVVLAASAATAKM
jgi:hypothetical protein